jgi:hypothetical protein
MLESITDFLIAIGVLWLLCIAMPLIAQIRQDSPLDDDIRQDWQDVRSAIRIQHSIIKQKMRRHK